MSGIQYAIRDNAGSIRQDAVIQSGTDGHIDLAGSDAVSLNIGRSTVNDYVRAGDDLELYLADGRRIVLDDYFRHGNAAHLYLNESGHLIEVAIGDDGVIGYSEAATWGKWGMLDALVFPDDPTVVAYDVADAADAAVAEVAGENEVASQALPIGLLGAGLTGLGAAGGAVLPIAAGAAALGGGALLMGTSSDSGLNSSIPKGAGIADPTVDNPDAQYAYNAGDQHLVTISGTAEPGARVAVEIGGERVVVTTGDDGTWQAQFEGGDFPDDGDYNVAVTVTNPDGSVVTLDGPDVSIDTVPPDLDIGITEGDNVVNAGELADGLQLQGTAEPGATVEVSVGGHSATVIATASGSWSVSFDASGFAAGEYDTEVRAVATDAAGNQTITTSTIRIDTEGHVTLTPGTDSGAVVTEAGAADGIVLSGSSEPGSQVVVNYGGTEYTATVTSSGAWTAAIPASAIAPGEYGVNVTVTATDAAGNVASTTATLPVDTVTDVAIDRGIGGADGIIDGGERAAGLTFTGTGEPGSSVAVSFEGTTHSVTVTSGGTWSATFAPGEIPEGEYDGTLTVVSTDAVGNMASASTTFAVDTGTAVTANTAAMGGDGVVNGAESLAGVPLSGTAEPGAAVEVTLGATTLTTTASATGAWNVTFAPGSLPSGESSPTVFVTATDSAGNVATTSGSVEIDTLVRNFGIQTGSGPLADGVLSGSDLSGGLTLTGTTEPGASVSVGIGTATRSASVAADGSWSVTFPHGTVPAGEYATNVNVTSTDRAGNVAVQTETVMVDTVAGTVAITQPVEIDDVVNAVEHADGVVVTGTATPGMAVTVGLAGASTIVTASAIDGSWSANFPAGTIPEGTYASQATAQISDSYGNTASASRAVQVDTELAVALDNPVAGDDIISGAEHDAGVTFTGSVDPGAVVSVKMGLVTHSASVAADGTWSVNFSPAETPSGEQPVALMVTATDAAGNTAMVTDTIAVDTLVTGFTLDTPLAGDGYLNAAEAAMGLTLAGTVETGATVVVDYNGTDYAAAVDASGNWSLGLTAAQLGTGSFDADVTVHATDHVGNTADIASVLHVDTDAPEAPYVSSFTRAGDTVRAITVPTDDGSADVQLLSTGGTVTDVAHSTTPNAYPGETELRFTGSQPDGAHMLVSLEDAAGNTSTTMVAMEDSHTDVVDLTNAGLGDVNLDAIDLRIAENSDLTISADLLENLSVNGNTLTIHGSEDDAVHIDTGSGALVSTGETRTIGSDTYDVYTLGDEGGTLIIDNEIHITT